MKAAERAILRELVRLKAILKEEEEILKNYPEEADITQPYLALLSAEVKELEDALKILREPAK